METEPVSPRVAPVLHRSYSATFRTHNDLQLGNVVQTTIARINRSFFMSSFFKGDDSFVAQPQDQCTLIIRCSGAFHRNWYSWMSFLIVYSCITSLYYVAYEWPGDSLSLLDQIVWAMFVIDLVLEFFTDFKDEDGQIVRAHREIVMRYLRGWFLFDLIAVIPISFFGHIQEETYLRLVRLMKIKRGLELMDGGLLRLLIVSVMRPKEHAEVQNLSVLVRYATSFLKILVSMLLTTYVLGAVFFWWSNFTLSWENAHADHFTTHFGLDKLTGFQNLLRSSYFQATTLSTVGYGDYYATNIPEKLLLVLVLLIGISQFSLIVAGFNGLLAEIDKNAAAGEEMNDLTTWFSMLEHSGRRVSERLKTKIQHHFQYYWDNDRLHELALCWWKEKSLEGMITSTDKYLADMPEECRREVLQFLFSDLRATYRQFFSLKNDFIIDICFHFQPRFYRFGQLILEQGEEVEEVVFLTKGDVACGIKFEEGFKDLIFYHNVCVIGDFEVLHNKPAIAAFRVVSVRGMQAFMLPAKVLIMLLKTKYPGMLVLHCITSEAKANYINSTLRKYNNPDEFSLNFFSNLQDRILLRRFAGPLPPPPPEGSTKKYSQRDLAELELRREREHADYAAKRNQLLMDILREASLKLRA